uniref:Uncharacterized protein n=1 Tax=Marmota marmota marmota TaxID=9994 RepID=A0A8C6A416_MARMA
LNMHQALGSVPSTERERDRERERERERRNFLKNLSISCLTVTLICSVLLLYPINLWIFEVKKNLSVPLGWSYFIGWLVFILYVSCGILCYLNYRTFRSVIVNHPSHTGSCSISGGSVKDTLNDQTISETNQQKFLDREQKNYTSAKLSIHLNPSYDHSPKS